MFDDLFLFAALQQRTPEKRMLVLSVRKDDEFDTFKRLGWQTYVMQNIMVSGPLTQGSGHFELIVDGIERETFPLVLGDLAAFSGENVKIMESVRPETIKANFVTSPMDGSAFLPAVNNDKMAESAEDLIGKLRSMGHTCWASTWHRNDVPPRIWQLGNTPEMDMFPFNIVGFRDPGAASMFQFMPEVFGVQEAMVFSEQEALAERLRQEIERRDENHAKETGMRDGYIRMLEDAMIALQPSEKIKLGGR